MISIKTYYDLTKEERKKYSNEFKQTPIGKQTNFKLNLSCVSAVICCFVGGFLEGYGCENETFINLFLIIAVFEAISIIVLSVYNNISFSSWLKIKYDIKRW